MNGKHVGVMVAIGVVVLFLVANMALVASRARAATLGPGPGGCSMASGAVMSPDCLRACQTGAAPQGGAAPGQQEQAAPAPPAGGLRFGCH